MPSRAYDVIVAGEDLGHFLFWGRARLLECLLGGAGRSGSGLRVLDLGCGTGHMLSHLQDLGAEVAGADPSARALELAQGRGLERLFEALAPGLPFAEEQFDLVIALDVLEHVEDDVAALQEMRRVASPGGKAVLFVPAVRGLWSRCDELVGHRRRYTKKELQDKLVRAGFAVERMTYLFPAFLLPAMIVRTANRLFLSEGRGREAVFREYAMPPPWLNALLRGLVAVEARVLSRHNFPFGVSLAAVAVRGD